MSVTGQMLDEADERAHLYRQALEDLTCSIELKSGQVVQPAIILRSAIAFALPTFISEALEILAARIEDALDREDLKL